MDYGIEEIMHLQPVSFEWAAEHPGERSLGLLAQDVEKVTPEVVRTPASGDEPYTMDYTQLIPVLIHAIQEQQKEIQILREKQQELQNALDAGMSGVLKPSIQ